MPNPISTIDDVANLRAIPTAVTANPGSRALENIAGTLMQVDDQGNATPLGGGAGTVTSVAATAGGLLAVAGTPTVAPTVGLAAIAADSLIGNNTGGSAVPVPLTVAQLNTMGLGLPGTPTTPKVALQAALVGAAAKTITWAGDSLMQGDHVGRDVDARYSPGYYLFGNFGTGELAQPGGFISTQLARQGRASPTINVTALAGKKLQDVITNMAWLTAQPDGSDVFANYGVNDLIAARTPAQIGADMTTVATAFFASKPNSRLHWLPILWNGSETATLQANGQATGTGANDTLIQQANAAIAAALAPFPNAKHYLQLYYDFYMDFYVNAIQHTQDFLHWSQFGAQMGARSLFRQMTSPGGYFPQILKPLSESDFTPGDWFEEVRQFVLYQSGSAVVEGGSAVLSFNRTRHITPELFLTALPAGAADAGVEGGGLLLNPVNFVQLSPVCIPTPKGNTPWAVAFRIAFNASAAGRSALFGLGDASVTAGNAAGDGIWIYYTAAAPGVMLILVAHAGAVTGYQLGTLPPAAYNPVLDTKEHTVVFFFDGNLTPSLGGIFTVFVDGQLAVYQNIGANFPQTPQFLQAGPCTSGGAVTFKEAILFYNESLP